MLSVVVLCVSAASSCLLDLLSSGLECLFRSVVFFTISKFYKIVLAETHNCYRKICLYSKKTITPCIPEGKNTHNFQKLNDMCFYDQMKFLSIITSIGYTDCVLHALFLICRRSWRCCTDFVLFFSVIDQLYR